MCAAERWGGGREASSNHFKARALLVFGVIDPAMPGERRDDDCRNAYTDTPAVRSHRRNDMVPTPAVFIVSDDDHRVFPNTAFPQGGNEFGDVLFARNYIRIAGGFV